MVHKWLQMTQRKKPRGIRSRDLGSQLVCPLCPIYGPRRTAFNQCHTLLTKWCDAPAVSKSDIIVWVTFHSRTVPTHHSTTGHISWHSLLLPGILVPKNGTMCHAPHGYSWVNLVIRVSCGMRIILLPVHGVVSFTYLLKWKCTSLLNMVSSAQILFDLNHSQNWTWRSVLSSHTSCSRHILCGWNIWCCIIQCTHVFGSTFSDISLSCDVWIVMVSLILSVL